MIAIGIAALPTFVRLARGSALAVTTEEYIESARSLACPSWGSGSSRRLPRGAACSTPPSATWCRPPGWRSTPA
jgi:hypothetical protein